MSQRFREALGFSESGGDYDVVNQYGYTGKYQWGPARLADFNAAMGTNYTLEQFRKDPQLQETAQAWHENDVMDYVFDKGLDYYIGQEVGGVPVTPEALIGMAHLGGKAGMRQFLESGGEYNPSDQFGTSLRDYGQKFSGTAYEQSEAAMGQTPLSYGESAEPSKIDNLMTAFEMMQGDVDICPPGTILDPVTNSCVPVEQFSAGISLRRPQARPSSAALERLGISSLIP